jgi:D-glycero-D-manno-heptose 1,7-bisphosphate phosphatase
MGRALFLDRNGAIHREAGYVFRRECVQFVQGVFSLCRKAKKLGCRLVVFSHEKGLAQGVYTEADYRALMMWICEEFRREGVALNGIYHCPSGPKPGRVPAIDRAKFKPGAGMLHRAARDLHFVSPSRYWSAPGALMLRQQTPVG